MKHISNILILIFTLSSSTVFACNCSSPKSLKAIQDYEFENSECVFIGEVLEVNEKENTFKIKVIESFKGEEKESIYNGIYDEQCGPIINEKGSWLIYAEFNSENTLKINECGLTRSLKNPEYNTVIDGLIEKRLKPTEKENEYKFILESRKVLELELNILRERKK